MSDPTISVVMACYNAGASVSESVQSILDQTYPGFEFIIVDDGSTDDTLKIISAFHDVRISVIENETNLGLAASLNKGIASARTAIVARMDADDVALPTRLERQYEYLLQYPQVDILGTSVKNRVSISDSPDSVTIMPTDHDDIVSRVFKKSLVLHPTVMIRKKVYDDIGKYDPLLRWAEDADLWYRIYDQIYWANLAEPLLIYTTKPRLNWKIVSNNLKVKWKNLGRRGLRLQYTGILMMDILNYSRKLIMRK